MSELGEYYQEKRQQTQTEKAKNLKWNIEVLKHLSAELGFKCEQHSEYHFTLRHKELGRIDYWPSTNKMKRVHDKTGKPIHGKSFFVPDLEKYLDKNFK